MRTRKLFSLVSKAVRVVTAVYCTRTEGIFHDLHESSEKLLEATVTMANPWEQLHIEALFPELKHDMFR
jgi:hypothetical protein